MLSNNHNLEKQDGQSLIEVLVVLVVATMMIVALITIILSSLKNAQFAQNQIKATKLAQDTVDKIRIFRDGNKNRTISDGLTDACFNELWNSDSGSSFYCGPAPDSYCYYQLDITSGSKLTLINSSKQSIGDGFYRQIKVNPSTNSTSNTEVKLIVQISWIDSSGEHNSNIETILIKPDYDCSD